MCKGPSENTVPGFIQSSRQLGAERSTSHYVWGARGENLNGIKWEVRWGKGYIRPLAGLQRSENFLASSPLLIALNMSTARGHLESQRGSLHGLGWLLRRSQSTHILAFEAVGDSGTHLFPLQAVTSSGRGGCQKKSGRQRFIRKPRCPETQLRRFELANCFTLPESKTGYKPFPSFPVINTQDTRLTSIGA